MTLDELEDLWQAAKTAAVNPSLARGCYADRGGLSTARLRDDRR